MTDKVVDFRAPKELPARWRSHSDILMQTAKEIDALRERLYKEMHIFLNVMNDDMHALALGDPDGATPDKREAMLKAWRHLDKGVRDAMTLLECASERVWHATPSDFEFGDR